MGSRVGNVENWRLLLKQQLRIDLLRHNPEHFDLVDDVEHSIFFLISAFYRIFIEHPGLSLVLLCGAHTQYPLLEAILVKVIVTQSATLDHAASLVRWQIAGSLVVAVPTHH